MSKAGKEIAPPKKESGRPTIAVRKQPSWNEIGDGFETMGKIGLAFAMGMSAAGLFCRLAEQGKVRVPTLSGLVLNRGDQAPAAHPNGGKQGNAK